jgi:hypothetical protein
MYLEMALLAARAVTRNTKATVRVFPAFGWGGTSPVSMYVAPQPARQHPHAAHATVTFRVPPSRRCPWVLGGAQHRDCVRDSHLNSFQVGQNRDASPSRPRGASWPLGCQHHQPIRHVPSHGVRRTAGGPTCDRTLPYHQYMTTNG